MECVFLQKPLEGFICPGKILSALRILIGRVTLVTI